MPEKKSIPKKITATNTKTEMLDAYNSLLQELEDARKTEQKPDEKIAKKEVEQQIFIADKLSTDSIFRDISDLKFQFGKALGELSEKLEDETAKYQSVKKAVEAKENELKEIYEIQKAASSLTALIEAQNQKRADFELEISEAREELEDEIKTMRDEWEKEKATHLSEIKERDSQEKKVRERQKEEFEYSFKLEQKQFKDSFEAEKAALERQLAKMKEDAERALTEREKTIKEKEDELNMLRQKAAGFQKELETSIAKSVKEATEKLIMENKFKESLMQKEFEGERNVFLARIQSLEIKIKEQTESLQNMGRQIEKSYEQVQDIAVKAVESAKNKYQFPVAEQVKKGE